LIRSSQELDATYLPVTPLNVFSKYRFYLNICISSFFFYQQCLVPRLPHYYMLVTLLDGQRPNMDFTFAAAEGCGVSADPDEPLEEAKEGMDRACAPVQVQCGLLRCTLVPCVAHAHE
jgi:hypothetical protein